TDGQIPDSITINYAKNADKVDGKHASAFASALHNHVGAVWYANKPWAYAGFRVNNSANGPSLWGVNTGGGDGVRGNGYGSSIGVYGQGVSGPGVKGNSASATGVVGVGNSGVAGYANSNTGVGVYGQNSAGGFAGYFKGNVRVEGTLYKSAGSFQIDHPLDPENKYLSHSFVESPDMMNVYNGNVVLDGNGEAWVELPDWFEALNRAFRYQLTPIGAPGPNLYVAEEISGNRFKIAGEVPGLKVSWQVTGIRQDAFALAHPIKVEENKPPKEQGYYLHPELYGQPKEKSVEWARYPGMMQQLEQALEKTASVQLTGE
ncbi:MAG: hypothetical protein JSU72_15575, partial [Deltaproteobacteria bacterium]